MPYDPVSLAVAALAGLLLLAAATLSNLNLRLSLIILAALIIRVDTSWQYSLNPWDERFHALVAKNLIADPLKPTLYRSPAVAFDYRDWTSNHVWLHKPPVALWLMAGSMRVFGVNELAMRLPSLLLSTGAVLLTFLIGRVLFNERVALLATGFHAVNGFLVALSAGRRVADHVDTALVFFVALGIWAALKSRGNPRTRDLVLTGIALGLAGLSKSAPALLILPVAFVGFFQRSSLRVALTRSAAIAVVGLIVVAPWIIYIATTFPNEASWSSRYTLMHMSQSVEGPPSSPFIFLLEQPRFFGELVWIPLVAATVTALRRRQHDLGLVLIWVAIPYLTFSMMSTRLPGYVMIAAPAVFLIEAHFCTALRRRLQQLGKRRHRIAAMALLVLLVALPARYLLEPTGSFERRERDPEASRELRRLSQRLGLADAVIFNIPTPIEAMFYSPYTAYDRMPTAEEVHAIRARGISVVVYEPRDAPIDVPADWPIIRLEAAAP